MGFFKKRKYATAVSYVVESDKNYDEELIENIPEVPEGIVEKCQHCGKIIYKKVLLDNRYTCSYCNGYFRMPPRKRLKSIIDGGSFTEFDKDMKSKNPISFKGYEEKLTKTREITKEKDAVLTGSCSIGGEECVIAIMNSYFFMGSMGEVVGEKITRAVEYATKEKLPVIIFTCSGGARMQEGIISLMQMAKVNAALAMHNEKGLLYIPVLTNPTTGGVMASFATVGDIILAEPNATLGFAGRRVIQQTIKQTLPKEFQTSEFLLKCGFVDKIVKREDMKSILSTLLKFHKKDQ